MPQSKGWGVTARSYGGLFYSKLMRFYDGYILGFLADSVKDCVFVDVGAGRCNLGFEVLKAGAGEVFAIENNPSMIKQIKKDKETSTIFNLLEIIAEDMYSGVISRIGEKNPFDVVQFKRSLYGSDKQIINVLQESYQSLKDNGKIFIIHPEKNKKPYYDDGFGRIALDHWLKRQFNELKHLFKNHQHRYLYRDELEDLCKTALPNALFEFLPSPRPAYNFLMIRK